MIKLDIDKLVSASAPVAEIEIDGVTKPIYAYEDMPVGLTVRLVEANAQYEIVQKEIERELEFLRRDAGSDNNPSPSQVTAIEAKIFSPLQGLLEAILDVEPGALSGLTSKQLMGLMGEVSPLVFPQAKVEEQPPQEVPLNV